MMNHTQLMACLLLLGAGFGYNAYVGRHIKHGSGDFMARFVALGVAGVVTVQTVAAQERLYTATEWGALTLLNFACGGAGMAWGSWQRRTR